MTSSSGPTMSLWYWTFPAHAPGRRSGRGGGHAMILATGCPFRATITSTPSRALRINSDNRDFAS